MEGRAGGGEEEPSALLDVCFSFVRLPGILRVRLAAAAEGVGGGGGGGGCNGKFRDIGRKNDWGWGGGA